MSRSERPPGPPLYLPPAHADGEGLCPVPTSLKATIGSFHSSGSSSGWSCHGSVSSRTNSYSSASEAPPTHSDGRSFDVWHARHVPPRPAGSSAHAAGADIPDWHLPCEFRWLDGCAATFAPDDLCLCVDHVLTHLKWRYPPRVSCWWCDDFDFDAGAKGVPAETVLPDRMAHIRDHILRGDYAPSTHPPRPDFHLLDFLWENGLVGEDVYARERARSEMPLPAGMRALPAGRGRDVPDAAAARVFHDIAKEERMRKMRARGEKESRTRTR